MRLDNWWEYQNCLKRRKARVDPNFFISKPWFVANGWMVKRLLVEEIGICWAVLDTDGCILFPLVPMCRGALCPPAGVWCDFEGYNPARDYDREEFDFEFLYDPASFDDLSGGVRKTFRKNVRRFEKENPLHEYREVGREEALFLFGSWLDEDQEIEGLDAILKYLNLIGDPDPEAPMAHALIIGEELVGINVWDQNYCYTNYRFEFHRRDIPFLSEYMRLVFYRYSCPRGKLVNDGGCLGSENLRRFKEKLGPKEIRRRFSWSLVDSET